jgi:hypothetical protein
LNDALFKTADDALRWAFRRRPVGERCGWPDYVGDAEDTESERAVTKDHERRPAGFDGIAQAGMILAEVDALERRQRAVIYSRYGRRGDRAAISARIEIALYVKGLLPDGVGWMLIDNLTQKYFGEPASTKDIAARCGVHRNTAYAHYKVAREALQLLEMASMERVRERLHEGGLLDGG